MARHFATLSATSDLPRGSQGVAIEGEAPQRGRLAFGASGCPVHALSALLHEQGIVLAQEPIDSIRPSDKAEKDLAGAGEDKDSRHPEDVVALLAGISPQNA